LNSNSNKATYKEFFGCSEIGLCNVWWFVFISSWPPLLWGAVIFSFLINFWRFLVCQMCQEEGFKFCLDTRNKRNPPFGSGLPWELKCSVTGRSTLHMEIVVRVLFFNFVMWSHTGDDPQTESAKFDYMLEWKVKIYKNCAIFWLLAPTNILHMEISKKKFLKIWWLWPFLFFTKNPLYELDTRCFLIRTKKD
jgi:hypothetical protein